MDRFIADAGKKTILFNAGEGGESGLSEKIFGTIFYYGYYVQPWRHCQRIIYKVGRVQANHTLLNSLE